MGGRVAVGGEMGCLEDWGGMSKGCVVDARRRPGGTELLVE